MTSLGSTVRLCCGVWGVGWSWERSGQWILRPQRAPPVHTPVEHNYEQTSALRQLHYSTVPANHTGISEEGRFR